MTRGTPTRRRSALTTAALLALAASPLVQFASEGIAHASGLPFTTSTASLDTVENGPWTLSQGDPAVGAPYSKSLPTYTPGGTPTQTDGAGNLAVYPASSTSSTPYSSGVVGTPGPLPAYCTSGGSAPESGTQASEPASTAMPMSPYYFPYVTQTPGDPTQGHLTGLFDYRPKDTEEAIVSATSTDGGKSWNYNGKALEENPENYCPTGDTNDNGQGHPFVMTVNGSTYLYTVNRPAGDNLGVGLLVHKINLSASNPLASLNHYESVGTDPDAIASGSTSVPTTGSTGVSIGVSTLGTGAETVGSGQFEDLNASSPSSAVITCTSTGSSTLTGCTTAASGGLTVSSGDPLVQVLADASAVSVPAGPNTPAETGGVSITLSAPLSTIAAANVPGRFYADGATIYCVNINGAGTVLENCTTTNSSALSIASGDAITTDPILPSDYGQAGGAMQTKGLTAPDGIVDMIPSAFSYPGAPPNSTVVIYGEKILNYYIVGSTTAAVTLPTTNPISITPSSSTAEPLPASGPISIYLGTASNGIQTVTCNAYSAGSFTGCTGGVGTVAAGNSVGGPGAANAPSAVLQAIGEGSTKPKTLFKNNEDLTVLVAAYTTNGIDFTNISTISGSDPSHLTDISNPSGQAYPSTINLPVGATDSPELRYVGTRGTILDNGGTLEMFDSGAWESDGDSDAFDQIFYTTSTDGVHWSQPVVVASTDYTFSAREQQDAALTSGTDTPLASSGYYAGRVYSPTVVQNPDGSLTLVFSGYSTPKPIPTVPSPLGDGQGGAPTWNITALDPALYRNILTMTLAIPPAQTPESPFVILLPLLGLSLFGVAGLTTRRRRPRAA